MLRRIATIGQTTIKLGAEVCAISAACAGVYAYFNPSVVSDYMAAVDENTRRTAEATENIDKTATQIAGDTQTIATDTGVLAGAVPTWLTVSYLTVDSLFKEPMFQVDVQNDTPTQIDSVKIALKTLEGLDVLRFGPYVLPPREVRNNRSALTSPRDLTLCITGTVAGKGVIAELRTLHIDGEAPNYHPNTVSRQIITDGNLPAACE